MTAENVHLTADVSPQSVIHPSSKIWHYAQVREGATIGKDCIVGRGAYIGTGVAVGDGCKVQNYALVYEPAVLESGVFIGPAAVLTNDEFPRAINPDLSPKSATDWKPVGVHIKIGASIGANATCVAPVTVGAWALVGSGSVVTKDVPDYALVVGTPAKFIRWVGEAGKPLLATDVANEFVCPVTGDKYQEISKNKLVKV